MFLWGGGGGPGLASLAVGATGNSRSNSNSNGSSSSSNSQWQHPLRLGWVFPKARKQVGFSQGNTSKLGKVIWAGRGGLYKIFSIDLPKSLSYRGRILVSMWGFGEAPPCPVGILKCHFNLLI